MAEQWKESGRTSTPSTDGSENDASDNQSEEEQQIYSDNEKVLPTVTKLPSSNVIKENHPDSSSDSSSGNISNGKSKKRSKNTRTADKALAGVQNLEHIQRNTDA